MQGDVEVARRAFHPREGIDMRHPPHRARPGPFEYYRRLARVREAVTENLPEDWNLERAASVAGLSPGYFCTFFKDKTGQNFRDWLHERRVFAAADLLRERNLTVAETAERVGYASTRTFERAFKRVLDTTPGAYRDVHRPAV